MVFITLSATFLSFPLSLIINLQLLARTTRLKAAVVFRLNVFQIKRKNQFGQSAIQVLDVRKYQ